jgi:hypothetical protein
MQAQFFLAEVIAFCHEYWRRILLGDTTGSGTVILPDQVSLCWSPHFSRTFCTYIDKAVNCMYTQFRLAQNSSFVGPL